MAKTKKIKSLTKYLSEIEKIETKHNVFFRGHSDSAYQLKPGIYRTDNSGKSLIEFEDKIYKEIIASAPQEFVGKNTLETLALMQHYEAPTRVLDLTENALVALYFACVGGEGKDGEVIVFDIPDDYVCHYDSDRVTILANLAKCDKDFYFEFLFNPFYLENVRKLQLYKMPLELHENYENFNTDILDFLLRNGEEIIEEYSDNFYRDNFTDVLNKFLERFEKEFQILSETDRKIFRNKLIEVVINDLNIEIQKGIESHNTNYFGKLLHNIREDKSYFDGIINPADVASVFAVKPKLNNPRIAKQHGAFLIFGIDYSLFPHFETDQYKPIAVLKDDWVVRGFDGDPRVIIDKDSKIEILQQLESLGFNQATLFPEVDKVASFVKNKYLKKL